MEKEKILNVNIEYGKENLKQITIFLKKECSKIKYKTIKISRTGIIS
nr:hypothetical protein [Clostridia bacterium]